MSETITRKQRRERMRSRKPARGRPAPRRRIGGMWIGLGVIAALALTGFGLFKAGVLAPGLPPIDLNAAKFDASGAVVGSQFPDEGGAHIAAGQKGTYNTDPPTSGPHWNQLGVAPAPWGIKDSTLPNEAIVHNLEHGGLVIFYKDLTDAERTQLSDLVRVMRANGFPKLILEPYPSMKDAKVALSAWRWQLKLPGYDDVQIVKFVKQHYQGPDAPERFAPP